MKNLAIASAVALTLLPAPALAADGTTAQRKAYAAAHPCPATGKPIITCSGYQLVWDRPSCLAGVQLMWLKATSTAAAKRRADQVARCTAHATEYTACMAQPYTLTPMCATTRGVNQCAPGQTANAAPAKRPRDCSAIVLK